MRATRRNTNGLYHDTRWHPAAGDFHPPQGDREQAPWWCYSTLLQVYADHLKIDASSTSAVYRAAQAAAQEIRDEAVEWTASTNRTRRTGLAPRARRQHARQVRQLRAGHAARRIHDAALALDHVRDAVIAGMEGRLLTDVRPVGESRIVADAACSTVELELVIGGK